MFFLLEGEEERLREGRELWSLLGIGRGLLVCFSLILPFVLVSGVFLKFFCHLFLGGLEWDATSYFYALEFSCCFKWSWSELQLYNFMMASNFM